MNTQAFPNIAKRLVTKTEQRKKDFAKALKDFKSLNDLTRYYSQYITPKQAEKYKADFKGLKVLALAKAMDYYDKDLIKELNLLNKIAEAPDFVKATITLEWRKSATWGKNPTAKTRIFTAGPHGNGFESTTSGSIGGCGYDKQSAAVARAMNQSDSFLKLLYTEFNRPKNNGKKIEEVFGYGSGYSLPLFSEGVGVSCYYSICLAVGFEFREVASGDLFDVYEITKKGAKK